MSQPDLFVVCRNCGSEVSPYVTECPYCGQRVRKRAPKLERSDPDADAVPRARRRTRLGKPRLATSADSVAPETRPVATFLLIGLSLLATLVLATDELTLGEIGGIVVPIDDQPWRYVTAPFVHENLAYQFVALVAVGVFGTMLERRFGLLAPVLVFLLAGAAGSAAAVAANIAPPFDDLPVYAVLGANGAALGMLFAWLVDDRMASRRGHDRGNDMIAVSVFAVVLLLIPLVVPEASLVAGVAGAATGALLGLLLSLLRRG